MLAGTSVTDFPSTVAHIGYHAATAPDHPAVIESGRTATYRDFYRDIGKMAGALAALDIGSGDTVAIEITGFYRHWVKLLACEVLGAGTLSFNQSEIEALGDRFPALNHVVCSPDTGSRIEAFGEAAEPENTVQAPKVHVADRDWLTTVARHGVSDISATPWLGADAPARIVKSYGTMGTFQLMVHTGRVHDFWLRQFSFRTTMGRKARYLMTAGFGIQAFHVHATSCIRMGGTCVCGNPNELAQDIARYGITHATFMPNQLEQLLAAQGETPLKPRLQQVFTIGAPVSGQVRARALQILADEVSESYGTNEAGGICSMDEDGLGTVFPEVAVEAVDDDGNACFESQGQIRVKSAGVVSGYLGDPETTARMFRDGWFYPGDIGVLYDRHRLTLTGRVEDFLDVGGSKYPLSVLEKTVMDALPAKDVCLLADGTDAEVALTLLVLTEKPEDTARIRREAPALMPAGVDRVTVIEAQNIPRGTDGKVQRAKLNWQLQQALAGKASG